jgi:mycothiol synthase
MINHPSLPVGWRFRHPTLADLQRVTDYQVSYDIAAFGKPDTSFADIEYEWERDGFQVDRDAWLVETDSGEIAAYMDIWIHDDEAYINHLTNVHPRNRDQLSQVMWYELAEQIAREYAGSTKQLRTISVESYSEQILVSLGYQAIQTQWRMVNEFDGPVPEPLCPHEYRLVPFVRELHAEEVFEVIETAFSELPHRTGNTYEGWTKFILDRSDFSPELLKMVMYKSEVAAVAIGFDNEIGGWIKQLAVKKAHRGKGLASYILKKLFYEFYQLGRSDVGLTVDSENRTGAPELYLRVGMKPTEKYVTFVRNL